MFRGWTNFEGRIRIRILKKRDGIRGKKLKVSSNFFFEAWSGATLDLVEEAGGQGRAQVVQQGRILAQQAGVQVPRLFALPAPRPTCRPAASPSPSCTEKKIMLFHNIN